MPFENEKPRNAPEGNSPERRLGTLLVKLDLHALSNKLIELESGGDIPVFTPTNQVHPLFPDQIVGRLDHKPNGVIILLHGVHWHRGRERKDWEKRARYEAAKFHVLEIAYGTMSKAEEERFWVQLEQVLIRVFRGGENVKYCGRIEDLMSLSMPEDEAVVFKS